MIEGSKWTHIICSILSMCGMQVESNCESKEIPALPLRSRIIDVEAPPLDDFFLPTAWYKARYNGVTYRIPDSSTIPGIHTCGAYNPIYISGMHPDIDGLNETSILLTACIRSEFSICQSRLGIHIRKCDGEVQYLLVPTFNQYSAYCLDPPNLQDTTEFDDPPENVNILRAEIKPSLQHVRSWPKIVIDCDVETEGNTTGLMFMTSWYVNSNFFVLFTNEGSTKPFGEEQLKVSGLGINISCSVAMKRSYLGKTSPFVSSDAYFAGIKVLTPEINLSKSDTAMVSFINTLPIGVPNYSHRNPIGRLIQMVYDDSVCSADPILIKQQMSCGVFIETVYPGEEWSPETAKIVTMKIASKDIDERDPASYILQLQVADSNDHDVWNAYRLQDIRVTVYDSEAYKHAICRSTNDPHMTTSDGYAYEHHFEGDFILYKNSEYPIEVQMRTKSCINNNKAYCTCAVAIRAGGDVFLIDHCNLTTRINSMISCSDGGILDITRNDDQNVEINTPIGTNIRISIWKYTGLMNIAIKMAPKDENNVVGLCGNFDGNINNDLMDRNGQSYTIDTEKSLPDHPKFSKNWEVTGMNYLKHDAKCLDDVGTWNMTKPSLYCTCSCVDPDHIHCEEKIPYCSPSQYLSCPRYNSDIVRGKCTEWETKTCTSSRRKRQAEIIPIIYPEATARQKREVINVTEEESEEMCRNAINQYMPNDIIEAAEGFSVTQAIFDCTFDTYESQSDEWVESYVRALNTVVNMNLDKDPDFAEANKDKVEAFKRQSCLSDCSGNGECTIQGFCDCYEGFSGSDCTISKTAQLNIFGVEGNGLCDLQLGDICESFGINTFDLMDDFVCRIVEKQVLLNGSKIELLPKEENGRFIDNYNGECFVNSTDRSEVVFGSVYDMYISNDGDTFSNRASLIVFDSLCQSIANDSNGDSIFVLKVGTCFISGRCYSSNEYNMDEKCEKCIPESNPFQWTKDCVQQTDGKASVDVLPIVLGTVIPTVVIFLVVAICYALLHKAKPKRCVTPQDKDFSRIHSTKL